MRRSDLTPLRWWDGQGRWTRAAVLILCGIAVGLGQAPLDLWWIAIPALAVSLLLIHPAAGARRAFGGGFWLGLGYFGFTLRWIVSPFMVDPARDGWMAPFAVVLMAAGFAAFWGAAGWIAHRLAPRSLLALALTLTGAEALRSLILTGFPWALLGHVWVDTGMAHLSASFGPHALTLMAALCAWGIARLVLDDWRGALPLVLALPWLVLTPDTVAGTDGPPVRVVQPNAPQDEKWDPVKSRDFFNRSVGMTGAAPRPALVVWPGTSIAQLMNYAGEEVSAASDAASGVPLVVGINRAQGGLYYNALIRIGRGGVIEAIYDKAHLAPFGEYIPGGELLARVGITAFASSYGAGFSPGGIQPLMDIPGVGPARALICYEGIFAEEIATAERPRLMILITNDAWFGKGAGPTQHLAQARLRAIEQGLPMVRSANTGISAIIDARGRIVEHIPLGETGFVDAPLPPARPATLYVRLGDWPVLVLLALALGGLAVRSRRLPD